MDEPAPLEPTDPELRQLLGLFDAPAFVRRARELEYGIECLHARCRRERAELLEMVHLRLRQWAAAVTSPDDWSASFTAPIDQLWPLTGAARPVWSAEPAPLRGQRALARSLVASLNRFNHRWSHFISELNLEFINHMIDCYNQYYVFEKECCLGSVRIAARHFEPKMRYGATRLLNEFPTLPVPELAHR
jgi:hypothetical protein